MADNQSEILLKLSAIDNLTPVMLKALQSMEQNSAKMASALDKVSGSTKQTQDNTEGLHGGVVSLAAGMEIAEKGIELVEKGFEVLEHQMERAIDASLEAEKAQTRLTGALVSTGQYTAELNAELNEYAEQQQKVNGVSAETVKGIMATGLQMGLSTEKAKDLVAASEKLAVATGTDVQSAFQKLQQSLAGHARGLAMNVAGVNDLSASQLKSGAAIDLVNQQLNAQFQIYQGSFAAGIARAHEGVEDLYKIFGNLITQNPAVKEALSQFSGLIVQLGDFVSANQGELKHWVSDGVLLMVDGLETLNLVFDAIYRGGVIAFNGIEGALQSLSLGVVSIIDGPFALLYKALSYLPGEQGKRFQAAADEITDHMGQMAQGVNKSSKAIDDALAGPTATSKKLEDGILKVREAVQGAIVAEGAHKKSLDDTNESLSKQNAQVLQLEKTYAGFTYGTLKQRQNLQLQVSDRDKDMKDFSAYLDAKERLAVSKAAEQQMAVNAIASKALVGAGGGSDTSAAAQVEIDTETKKQAQLDVLRKKGILNEGQYQNALLASKQREQSAQLQMDQAFEKSEADLLGNTPAGQQKKLLLAQQQFQMKLAQKKIQAQQEGLSQRQIDAMTQQEEQNNLVEMKLMKEKFIQDDLDQNQTLGNNWKVTLDQIALNQEKFGVVMGTLRGVQQSEEFKGTMSALDSLASLRNSKSKGAFEVGKAAAIAGTVVHTSMAAMEGYSSLASIPFVGPVLGAAAAAAAIAAGAVQISNIKDQKFDPGGQADQGMDMIPSALSGKSFVLSQGERVVQPEANKDLTAFLDRQKSGTQIAGGGGVMINLTYNGNMSVDDVKKMADMLIKEIRARSDRGSPIMNSKGLVNT